VILTDREIQIAIERKLIEITPPPNELAYSSTSVDLTLDPNLNRFRENPPFLPRVIDVTHPDYDFDTALAELSTPITIGAAGFELPKKELLLGWTAEYINIPTDARLAARVEGKSSLARLGIGIHLTATNHTCWFQGAN